MSLSAAGGAGARLRAFLGFSRFLQATLSVAQPFFVGLVALHGLPSPDRLVLALSAAWAGFLAVFALNDLLDVDLDRRRFDHLRGYDDFDIDSAMSRHPLAQQQMAFSWGLAWIGGLGMYAMAIAYILSPYAALLFALAAALELMYCKLARVTPLKTLVSGAMVGVGALAGWVAMTSEIRPSEMAILFVWMCAWEIGGRNIVNDFADVEEDTLLGVKTVPLVYGPRRAAQLTFGLLVVTATAPLVLQPLSHLGSYSYLLPSAAADLYLLLWPGLDLLRSPVPRAALALFNKASFYPAIMLAVIIVSIHLPS